MTCGWLFGCDQCHGCLFPEHAGWHLLPPAVLPLQPQPDCLRQAGSDRAQANQLHGSVVRHESLRWPCRRTSLPPDSRCSTIFSQAGWRPSRRAPAGRLLGCCLWCGGLGCRGFLPLPGRGCRPFLPNPLRLARVLAQHEGNLKVTPVTPVTPVSLPVFCKFLCFSYLFICCFYFYSFSFFYFGVRYSSLRSLGGLRPGPSAHASVHGKPTWFQGLAPRGAPLASAEAEPACCTRVDG